MLRRSLGLASILILSPLVAAQSINLSFTINGGTTPSSSYGAAANQPGVWNSAPIATGTLPPLVSVTGAPTNVTCTVTTNSPVSPYGYDYPGVTGDDSALLESALWIRDDILFGADAYLDFHGLAQGRYDVYVYSVGPWAESLAGGGYVAGYRWAGNGFVEGETHSHYADAVYWLGLLRVHMHEVSSGGGLDVLVNGIQIVALPTAVESCDPGSSGTLACPCANPPSGASRGCDNSDATGGATLGASGLASVSTGADSLVFTSAGERSSATSILLQGDAQNPSGILFGQGVRCASGSLLRMYVKTAVAGSITAPGPGDPKVDVRSNALGSPILTNEHRWYCVYYRDPNVLGGCPGSATFNTTPTLDVLWISP